MKEFMEPIIEKYNDYRKHYYDKPKAILLSSELYYFYTKYMTYIPYMEKETIKLLEIPVYPFLELEKDEFYILGKEFLQGVKMDFKGKIEDYDELEKKYYYWFIFTNREEE